MSYLCPLPSQGLYSLISNFLRLFGMHCRNVSLSRVFHPMSKLEHQNHTKPTAPQNETLQYHLQQHKTRGTRSRNTGFEMHGTEGHCIKT